MSHLKMFVAALCCLATLATTAAFPVERPFAPGSVWTVTFVRVKPGMDATYLLLVEQKNWAAFDGAGDKFDTIAEKRWDRKRRRWNR